MRLDFQPEKEESPKKDSKPSPFKNVTIKHSIEEMAEMNKNEPKESGTSPPKKIQFDQKKGRANGVKPKFVRARELHKYLFYLSRDFTGMFS